MDVQNHIMEALAKIDSKVDRIDSKMDQHAERIAVVEVRSKQNEGMIRLALTGIITVIASAFTYLWNSLTGKH